MWTSKMHPFSPSWWTLWRKLVPSSNSIRILHQAYCHRRNWDDLTNVNIEDASLHFPDEDIFVRDLRESEGAELDNIYQGAVIFYQQLQKFVLYIFSFLNPVLLVLASIPGPRERGPGVHCLRVGGFNSKFASKTVRNLTIITCVACTE